MESSGPPIVKFLSQQPVAALAILDLYEGFAQSCDVLLTESADDKSVGRMLEKYREIYRKRVGVDFTERLIAREALNLANVP